jgi:putative thioredoxin
MTPDIIEVNESDFDFQVLAYSQEIPVLVDFWAPWCAPCRVLSPILEKLAEEAQGGFRLALVNVDENPNLSKRYQVHSIPAVKAFRAGRIVAEFSGLRPENQLREFLRSITPSASDLAIEKGNSLLQMHQARQAELAFREALAEDNSHPGALLGLCQSLLQQGLGRQSLEIIKQFPASREYNSAQALMPLAEALALSQEDLEETEKPLDAAYQRAVRLIQRGNTEAALDGLLDILREDKRYRNGKAKQLILAVFELLGESDPITQAYRSELASVLF